MIIYFSPESVDAGRPCMVEFSAVTQVERQPGFVKITVIPAQIYAHPHFRDYLERRFGKLTRVYDTEASK